MRYLLYTSLLFSFFSSQAQHVALNKIDEFTDDKVIQVNAAEEKTWSTSDNIAKGIFNSIFLSTKSVKSKEETLSNYIQLDISTGSMICLSKYDGKVIFLLDNNEKVNLKQVSKIDCGQRVLSKFILNNDDLEKLTNNKIIKFRIYTTEGYMDFETKEKKQELIKNHFILFKKTINQ